jgi:hypothetical protein
MNNLDIKLLNLGDNLGPRVFGIKLKEDILRDISSNNYDLIVFDFEGIKSISTGFSKELFGELYLILKDDFNKKIRFKISEDQIIIKSIIAKALEYVISKYK